MNRLMHILPVVCLALLPVSHANFTNILRRVKYVVVLNADYNKTSVSAFLFETVPDKHLKVVTFHQESVFPGLPAYFNNSKECIPGLKKLIENAQTLIPLSERRFTTLMLIGATGFRLYPKNPWPAMSETILKFFKTTGLRVGDDAVSLMEGRKKLYLWLSVNLNLGRLEMTNPRTVTTLNLGSRYSDVAFVPEDDDRMPLWRWKLVRNLTAFNRKYEVYSYSYFGLGMNEIRLKVFEQDYKEEKDLYQSYCVNYRTNTTWNFRGKNYNIIGAATRKEPWEISKKECLRRINKVLDKFERSASLDGKELYADSYFYKAVLDAKIVEKGFDINVTVDTIFEAAKKVCDLPLKHTPFLCLDLLYIHSLFTRIYSLTNQTKIRLAKSLYGHDINWPLGAAFEVYQGGINNIGSLVQKPTFS